IGSLNDQRVGGWNTVKVGGEAFLNCYLMKSEDVVQVTWQKISPEMNLATNSKYFSPRVNPEFRHKVEFKDAGLQNSTIIIKNVKQQDEGCYNCLFNIQHQGAITCKTCLQIYGKNLLASLNVCFFSSIPVEIPALEPTHVCSLTMRRMKMRKWEWNSKTLTSKSL
uniref:Ig-like domain-containing protein n=1 Tax=Sphaeramia orbicularis TaxID=375764 RepID=A0A672YL38_9TELE